MLLKDIKPDKKIKFPKNLLEAKDIIRETFSFNNWKEPEQKRYLKSLDIENDLPDLSLAETRKVINDLYKSGMVLFEVQGSRFKVQKKI